MPSSLLIRRHVAFAIVFGLVTACTELRPLGERSGDAGADSSVQTCGMAGACTCTPALATIDLRVVAHGSRLTITGGCFSDVTSARIAGVDQTFTVVDDATVRIDSVSDATPIGTAQGVVLASPVGASKAIAVPVAHLVLAEVDSVTEMGAQRHQFVEIATGLDAALDLGDYALVIADGADDGIHSMPAGVVLGTTLANGRFLIGSAMVASTQATIANDALTGGANATAIVIVQQSTLPDAAASLASVTSPMIDAIVFAGSAIASDTGLLTQCIPNGPDRVQLDEDANGAALTESIRRCADTRRAGTAFGLGAPTPGAANGCP